MVGKTRRARKSRESRNRTKASAKPKVDDKNAVELRRLEEERLARRAEQERIKREAAERERLAKQREADQKRQAEEDLARAEQRVNELWQKHRHNFCKADGRIWRASDATGTSLEGTLRITQVVDAWNTIVQAEEFGYVKQTWWITEIPTGKLVDDAKFRMNNGDFAFIGTKRYPSLLGTRTVRLAVPVAVTNSGIGLDDFHTVVAQGIPLGPAKQTAKEAQRAAEERERQRLADERADAKLREAARQARL